MIYITGDCHSDFRKFNKEKFPIQTEMTKDDYVIICGDFGGVWAFEEESEKEKYWLDWLNQKNFTTLFVDGNHENFTRLYNYPVEKWHGGKVHKIRPSVLHLMRGEIFSIDGKKIFLLRKKETCERKGDICLKYTKSFGEILLFKRKKCLKPQERHSILTYEDCEKKNDLIHSLGK